MLPDWWLDKLLSFKAVCFQLLLLVTLKLFLVEKPLLRFQFFTALVILKHFIKIRSRYLFYSGKLGLEKELKSNTGFSAFISKQIWFILCLFKQQNLTISSAYCSFSFLIFNESMLDILFCVSFNPLLEFHQVTINIYEQSNLQCYLHSTGFNTNPSGVSLVLFDCFILTAKADACKIVSQKVKEKWHQPQAFQDLYFLTA